MVKFTLFGAGLMMLIPGVLYLVDPQMMLEAPAIKLQSIDDHHLVRAAYGGAFIGTAVLFLLGAFRSAFQQTSLIAACVLLSGFALGRIVSIAVDGRPVPLYLGILAAEVFFAGLAALALQRVR